eukprot:CAMPEP_0203934956 /NCGR_PEP_ID=MMETSP0359-20131031/72795_1 /ASSEMBLY_ACC=CAM_ASM_000338 /TAXON_ID=268821 /ORGANISM="Scrippsiella Hangoei, Strain SHTV-5" /LENGTH=767 /DNA_ID=CAMNT_0050864729 /DNA_START=241 /DNA_END=2544 /DNA_ORIENTATION=-
MTRKADSVWDLTNHALGDAPYAFIAEWTQEWRISGQDIRCDEGEPSEEAAESVEVSSVVPAGADEQVALNGFDSAADSVSVSAAGTVKKMAKQKSPLQRLGKDEFVVEAQDMGQFAVDATGTRVNLIIADRIIVEGVTVAASDGSWGPVALQCAEPELALPSAGDGSAAGDASRVPAIWIGNAVDLEFGTIKQVELVVRVRRRDWRIDPSSLGLCQGMDSGALPGGGCARPPPGPAFWSVPLPMPQSPPAFARCGDRDLVLYEMHIGSFTQEGTLKAATAKLSHIRNLGCTAISVMPVNQDLLRANSGNPDCWGYDVISFFAVDSVYGTPTDLVSFVAEAHRQGLAVVIDFVINHMMWGADSFVGPQYFLDMQTTWGPRPNFEVPEVRSYALAAAELLLSGFGFDGLRVDSTKSIRKYPNDAPDAAGAGLLGDIAALCRRAGKLAIAEDLEDGDGVLQFGGLGLHMQWDMAFFCWAYEALTHPLDEHRDLAQLKKGLQGLSPARSHPLRGRVLFMESHDTATSDRYGRLPAAVHNGKAFMAPVEGEQGQAGADAFQKLSGAMPYPSAAAVEGNPFAARRAAIGLVMMMTAPGVPMLLQGQEVYECGAFKWPRGPALDWQRVAATSGNAALWQTLTRNLIKLRLTSASPSLSPLVGDGVHVCHAHGGVLAYLRWAEVADSRTPQQDGPELALVVLNFTNSSFPMYELGVPPSSQWRLALSTVNGSVLSAGDVADIKLNVTPGKAAHGFACTLPVALPSYCASIFLRTG